jgi:hypothetical protein
MISHVNKLDSLSFQLLCFSLKKDHVETESTEDIFVDTVLLGNVRMLLFEHS